MSVIDKRRPQRQVLRRFEDLPRAAPNAVVDLPTTHPAIVGHQPLFPDQIFSAENVNNLFVSGKNNRKIGSVVTKGAWSGMPIYMLTLPERVTCPTACHMYRSCYGGAMHMAKRIAPGQQLELRARRDIAFLASKHPRGFVLRLHILGDFYSVNYVRMWRELLTKHRELHIYGYTARGMMTGETPDDVTDRAIFNELQRLKIEQPLRFAMRWSRPEPQTGHAVQPDSNVAMVLGAVPREKPGAGIICPTETEDTACCATCGLCWEENARGKPIFFIKHGMGSSEAKATAAEVQATGLDGMRQIAPITNMAKAATKPIGKPPILLWISPSELWIEEGYQRELNQSSIRRIGKMVREFNWGLFTPPTCVKLGEGRYAVIDGQHSAIAAASHPEIDNVPILIVDAEFIELRAGLFIGKNWERVTPTRLQRYKAEIVHKNPEAQEIERICAAAGVEILAIPPAGNKYKPGQTLALAAIRKTLRTYGADSMQAVLTMLSGHAPLRAPIIVGVAAVLFSNGYRGRVTPEQVSKFVARLDHEEIDGAAKQMRREFGTALHEATASIIYQKSVTE